MLRNKYLFPIFVLTLVFIYYLKYIRREGDHIYDEKCHWPPNKISDIENEGVYDLTLCIKLTENASTNSIPKRYPMGSLFHGESMNRYVTFEELGKLPREYFKWGKFPNLFNTYPQDVPMRNIVRNIKEGKPVCYVSNII